MLRKLLFSAFGLSISFSSFACADTALLIGNQTYLDQPNAADARFAIMVDETLKGAGFDVLSAQDATPLQMAQLLAQASQDLQDTDRFVVFLAGQFATTAQDGFLLAREAQDVTAEDVATQSLPMQPVMDMLAKHPGKALLLVGSERPPLRLDTAQRALVSAVEPNGVTVLQGPARGLALGLTTLLEQPQKSVRDVFDYDDVTMAGFLPHGVGFAFATVEVGASETSHEAGYFALARELDSEDGYRRYLIRYPEGRFAAQARARVTAIEAAKLTPIQQAQAAEQALALTRDARRALQRDLKLIGFNPGGIDGILGRGSRTAIGRWQEERGFERTGYVTANQLSALTSEAAREKVRLAEQAERDRQEQSRRDTALWESLGPNPDANALRDYLRAFPNGNFATVAKRRLNQWEAEERAKEEARERARDDTAWAKAKGTDTRKSYRVYLGQFPQGTYAQEARKRIRALSGTPASQAQIARDKADEAQVTRLPFTREAIEQKLNELNFNAGAVDGRFTSQTRQAIRDFQTSRNIPVTGYVGQATVVALLSQ